MPGTSRPPRSRKSKRRPRRAGQQVIVIEPANPQVVYVPQYNPQTVYVQPAPTTVVVEDNSADAAVAGLIGFTAGIAIGAAVNNNYYYGPYGWHGGAYMYNDAWDDYYDHREDAREDWQDHREDLADERGDRAGNVSRSSAPSGRRTGRRTAPNRRQQRTEQPADAAGEPPRIAGAARRRSGADGVDHAQGLGLDYESRGYTFKPDSGADGDAGTKRDPLGRILGLFEREVERAASSRGQSSRSSSARRRRRRRGRRRAGGRAMIDRGSHSTTPEAAR